jgi:hypothetical protein
VSRRTLSGVVEVVDRYLDDGMTVGQIAATLRLPVAEVGRIARLIEERGPAEPAPDVDVQAVAEEVDALDVDEDEPEAPTRIQVKAAALLACRATSGADLDDLAGMLGIRHAVEPAERWLAARAAGMAYISEPAAADDNHDDCFGCVNEPVSAEPAPAGRQETPAETAALAEVLAVVDAPWPLALEAAATVALDRDPEYGTHTVDGHVHDPYTAWHETGVPYAACTGCDTTWERTTCQVCPAIVAALHVATFGPIHKHCAAKQTATATERTNP